MADGTRLTRFEANGKTLNITFLQNWGDNFGDLVTRANRLPGMTGGFDELGAGPAMGEVGTITANFALVAESKAQMTAQLDELRAIAEWGKGRLYMQPADPTEGERWCAARLNTITTAHNYERHTDLFMRVQATWQVAYPRWERESEGGDLWGQAVWGEAVWAGSCVQVGNAIQVTRWTWGAAKWGNRPAWGRAKWGQARWGGYTWAGSPEWTPPYWGSATWGSDTWGGEQLQNATLWGDATWGGGTWGDGGTPGYAIPDPNAALWGEATWGGGQTAIWGQAVWGGSTTTIPGVAAAQYVNEGNAEALVRIVLHMLSNAPEGVVIEHWVGTGRVSWVAYDAQLTSGQTLVIDGRTLSVTLDGYDAYGDFDASSPRWIRLAPGNNTLKVDFPAGGAARLRVRYAHTYI